MKLKLRLRKDGGNGNGVSVWRKCSRFHVVNFALHEWARNCGREDLVLGWVADCELVLVIVGVVVVAMVVVGKRLRC